MENQSVCPWWMGYSLLIPIRRFQHDPYKILGAHIEQGMTVMDYGSAMGYFSIPMAKMTGPSGKVYCVDIQEKMLAKLKSRAENHGVLYEIQPLLVGKDYNPSELKEKLDLVLLFMVAHEVADQKTLFSDLFTMLKPGGKVLFSEPEGHVKREAFEKSIQLARGAWVSRCGRKAFEKRTLRFFGEVAY